MSVTSSPNVLNMILVDWMSEQAGESVNEWAKLVINFLCAQNRNTCLNVLLKGGGGGGGGYKHG